MHKLTLAAVLALTGAQFAFSNAAQADHRRHWFFGSYETYDRAAINYGSQPQIYRPRGSFPWRDRRVRYDLSPKQREKAANRLWRQQQKALAHPPVPRTKPYLPDAAVRTGRLDPQPYGTEHTPAIQHQTPSSRAQRQTSSKAPAGDRVSCSKAKEIVAGFGFSDIEASNCSGSTYSFVAKREGRPFAIKLSSLNGELTEVTRQ